MAEKKDKDLEKELQIYKKKIEDLIKENKELKEKLESVPENELVSLNRELQKQVEYLQKQLKEQPEVNIHKQKDQDEEVRNIVKSLGYEMNTIPADQLQNIIKSVKGE